MVRKTQVRMVERWLSSKAPGEVFLIDDIVAALSTSWNAPTRPQILKIILRCDNVVRAEGWDRQGPAVRSKWMIRQADETPSDAPNGALTCKKGEESAENQQKS